MKIEKKSEKGYTGVDIAISVVVLFIFISIIATLSYRFNSSSKQMELESIATSLAIDEIERIKNTNFTALGETDTEEIPNNEGFYRTIQIQDYAEHHPGTTPGVVKKVIVKIQYRFKAKTETVELSTIMTKES